MSAAMLNSTWNIPTQLLLAMAHLFGGRFAGFNYIGLSGDSSVLMDLIILVCLGTVQC